MIFDALTYTLIFTVAVVSYIVYKLATKDN
jgi:hypothetical protein